MKPKSKKPISAAELMTRLQRDPEWVRKNAERESKRQAKGAEIRAESKPLVADLNAIGINVTSVWDLVNSSASYPAAIPVLCKHLSRPYRPEIREGIARALTVAEARGPAARVVLAELQRPLEQSPHSVRWALANALTVAADANLAEGIEALIADDRFEDVRERLKVALKSLAKRAK